MGKRGVKSSYEETNDACEALVLNSDEDADEDAEANEDLSLKIVEKSMLRKLRDENSGGAAVENGGIFEVEMVENGKESKEKKKEKKTKKKKQRTEAEVDSADVSKGEQKMGSDRAAEIVSEDIQTKPAEVSENSVLRKLLRGPRYFDPPDSSWGTCYNCGEEGHKTAKCPLPRRNKPCFVCGSLEHNVKQCSKAKDCFICKKGGHRAKDCPDKDKGRSQNSMMCLKCGESGHDMFSCQNNYSPDDLKEIQCYICKCFGHLCCADYIDSGPKVVSCYRCGLSGHTGLACARSRGETSGSNSVSSCFRCGEEGHFARECINFTPALKRNREFSTPKRRSSKEKRWKLEVRSAPNEIGVKSRKKRKTKYEGQIASASKQKPRHGWLTEHPGDSFSSRFKTPVRRSPATSSYKKTHQGASPHTSTSRSSRKLYRLDYNNSSNGSANFPHHRYSDSKYG